MLPINLNIKINGCSSECVPQESYPIVVLSESVLRESFRCRMKALRMPIQF